MRFNKCNVKSYGGHKIESLGKFKIKCMKLLYPQIPIDAYVKMLAQQNIQKCQYDKNVRIKENKFAVNDSILYLKDNVWEKGTIIKKCKEPRSFIIKNKNNLFRRTSRHVRYDNGNMEESKNIECERERRKEIGIKNKETVITLGDSFKTISFSYRLGHATVYKIVIVTCQSIVKNLMPEYMPQPTEERWKQISNDFWNVWNFPNCLGALDGKHVIIQAPANSVVLLALVDANYNFIAVDVGAYGKNSDGGILAHSNLGKSLENGSLNIPSDAILPNTNNSAPYVILGDEAFPLKTYLMRPYPGKQLDDLSRRIYNYRLCRTRRVVENCFGILAQKFRIYNRRIHFKPENVDYIILANCVLHNFIKKYRNCTNEIFENTNESVPNTTLNNIPIIYKYHSVIF
ncbi:hypothetical protein AGLY_002310 [Aphis glycines]|uniref:DDE Tnp4 domain-containing protein n=1 Tax=Aphis glycines TaxID=307491 RepID=A0A6G0U408_APHGL|nr:hypothetical protein AGLY_002310 [Aphis glycines]